MIARRGARVAAVATMVTVGVILSVPLGVGGITSAGAATPVSAFYLDIGGSASVGVQPTTSAPFGQPTSDGYANDLISLEAVDGLSLQLDQIGCPGETTMTMLYGGKSCYQSPNSQLSAAITFLSSHQADSGVVTIDLGFNNVVRCLKNLNVVKQCVNQGLAHLRDQLTQILTDLEVVAGPNVSFVGVGHYDPFLADALSGPAGRLEASQSLQVIGRLNRTLSAVFHAHDMAMANVAGAFQSADTQLVALAGVGMVPQNVTNVCAMTWMCQSAPLVANLHPNDLGYQAIAFAIEAKVPASL